jgi:hypothetical protein
MLQACAREPAMPREGSQTLSDLRSPVLSIACERCGRVRTLQRRSALARARRPEADRLPRRTDGRLPERALDRLA